MDSMTICNKQYILMKSIEKCLFLYGEIKFSFLLLEFLYNGFRLIVKNEEGTGFQATWASLKIVSAVFFCLNNLIIDENMGKSLAFLHRLMNILDNQGLLHFSDE